MVRFSEHTPSFLDPDTGAETARLVDLHQWSLRTEGGLFPEEPPIHAMRDALDIACGPGSWALDVAKAYPHLHVTGIDSAYATVEYARASAYVRRLPNISFLVMDICKPLAFAENSFDLINIRSLFGSLPASAWLPLLKECLRVTRPGGVLRLTETEWCMTTSSSLQQLGRLISQALARAGRSFTPEDEQWMITPFLPTLLRKVGYGAVDHLAHAADFSSGSPARQCGFEDLMTYCKLLQPFVCHWTPTTRWEYEDIYQQALTDMLSDGFCGMRTSITAWGYKHMPQREGR